VDEGVGTSLREARIGRGLALGEVEEATKIRVPFLSAIEAEDWDALPGDAYARGFVRAYAGFLGLDGARLAAAVPSRAAPLVPGGEERRGLSRSAQVALVCLGLVAVIGVVGLLWSSGGDDESSVSPSAGGAANGPVSVPGSGGPHSAVPSGQHTSEGNGGAMELSLTTGAELWVCLLDEDGKPLVDGVVLPAGAEEGPFRSGSFTVSFGNGEVEMLIDGRNTDIPESASPLGYEVGRGGELSPLSETERPTCL
jgi:hypothetical protein